MAAALFAEEPHAFKMEEKYSMGRDRRTDVVGFLINNHEKSPLLFSKPCGAYFPGKGFVREL